MKSVIDRSKLAVFKGRSRRFRDGKNHSVKYVGPRARR